MAAKARRARRAVAIVCIALVVCWAVVPAITADIGAALLVPLGFVVPAILVTLVCRNAFRCDEQPIALVSLLDSPAPPALA
jgi:hypothetical protein